MHFAGVMKQLAIEKFDGLSTVVEASKASAILKEHAVISGYFGMMSRTGLRETLLIIAAAN